MGPNEEISDDPLAWASSFAVLLKSVTRKVGRLLSQGVKVNVQPTQSFTGLGAGAE